jgi:hypothetical protein
VVKWFESSDDFKLYGERLGHVRNAWGMVYVSFVSPSPPFSPDAYPLQLDGAGLVALTEADMKTAGVNSLSMRRRLKKAIAGMINRPPSLASLHVAVWFSFPAGFFFLFRASQHLSWTMKRGQRHPRKR